MPIEGGENEPGAATLCRVRLTRKGKPIKRDYCAFWKADIPDIILKNLRIY